MIVGRDTACLDEAGVTKAAVETVAENTSDGVIAPMIALAVGGPFFGFLYKAVNTMDSMIGYKNDRYLLASMTRAAAYLAGRDFDGTRALSVYRRDRRKHASPNSAHT